MRTLIALTLLSLVASDSDCPAGDVKCLALEKEGECLVDGGESMDDASDAAMFIWAASKRCSQPKEKIKCVVDVTSAIGSINGMANVLLRAFNKCGHLKVAHKKCGMAVGRLTKNVADLAGASADIIQKCPNPLGQQHSAAPAFTHALALCTVDIKDTAKSMFKLVKEFMQVKPNCKKEDKRHCAANSFRLAGAFAGIGEYLSGSIGHCSKNPKHNDNALCAQGAAMLVHHISDVAAAATDLSRDCEGAGLAPAGESPVLSAVNNIPAPRLFEQEDDDTDGSQTSNNNMNVILGAFLPVTAIVGFSGGRFYANKRKGYELLDGAPQVEGYKVSHTADFMSDSEGVELLNDGSTTQ